MSQPALADLEQPGTGYRQQIPELDGLRAVAILAVMFFHLQLPGCSLGWTGVPLFFVISGFLITRILLKTREQPHYFRNFYVRRSLRIFPIYYLTLAVYFVVLACISKTSLLYAYLGGSSTNPWAQLPYYLGYVQTIPQLESQYTALPYLSHTWSLALEEQFYWLWPIVILALRGKALVTTLMSLLILGPVIRVLLLMYVNNPYYMVSMLPDQFDTLAYGSLIAWLVHQRTSRQALLLFAWSSVAIGGAMLGVLIGMTGYSNYGVIPNWVWMPHNVLCFTAVAVLFGGFVTLCVAESRATRWLMNPRLMEIGRISYGLYMYHGYVFLAAMMVSQRLNHGNPPTQLWAIALKIAVSLGGSYWLAKLSWKYIEHPLNSLKDRYTRGSAHAPAAPAVESVPVLGQIRNAA